MASKLKDKCYFCDKKANEVAMLLNGLEAQICDACTSFAKEIIDEALGQSKTKNKSSIFDFSLQLLPI